MNTKQIIIELDKEIERLTQVRALLAGANNHAARKSRTLSPEARMRIANAQKKRWAKVKKQKKS